MALEYIVAGRRSLPGYRIKPWTWVFEIDCDDDDAMVFDEGSFELAEVRRRGNTDFYAFVEKHVGYAPKSVLTIRKAGWEFSRAAAEVLAAALDGVLFVDGLVDEQGIETVMATQPAKSIRELEERVEAASRDAETFFLRWEVDAAKAQADHDRLHPSDAVRRGRENDWSDL